MPTKTKRRAASKVAPPGFPITDEVRAFCTQHNVALESLLDATGMRRDAYYSALKATGKLLAANTPRGNSLACYHGLRTSSGHCAICRPSVLAYTLRHYAGGYVYIAHSKKRGWVKVGCSSDIDTRMRSLNAGAGYGNTSDWREIESVWVKEAGRIESMVKSALAGWGVKGEHYRGTRYGASYEAGEMYECDIKAATTKLRAVVKVVEAEQARANAKRFP